MLPLILLREVILYLSLRTIHTLARVNKFCARALANDKLWYRKYHLDFDQEILGEWLEERQITVPCRQLYFLHYYLTYTQLLEENKETILCELIHKYAENNHRSEIAIDGESILIHYANIRAPMDIHRLLNVEGEDIALLPTKAMISLHYRIENDTLLYYALITETMDELDEMFDDLFPGDIPILYQMADVSLDLVLYYVVYFRENHLVPQPYNLTIPEPLLIPQLMIEEGMEEVQT